jgi:hypothetical protein
LIPHSHEPVIFPSRRTLLNERWFDPEALCDNRRIDLNGPLFELDHWHRQHHCFVSRLRRYIDRHCQAAATNLVACPCEARDWTQILACYRAPSPARSIIELAITAGPLILLWFLMWATLDLG